MRRLSAEIQSILHEAREGGSERLEEFFSAPVSTGALKSALNGIQGELSSVVGSLDDLGKRGIRRRKASHVKGLIHRLDKVGGMVREALVEARKLLRTMGEEVEEDLGDELPCLDEETGSDCWQLQEAVQFVADDMAESTGLDPEVLSAALVEAMSCKSECREKYVTEKGDFKGGKGDAFKTCEKYAEACCTGVKDPGAFCAYVGRRAGKI